MKTGLTTAAICLAAASAMVVAAASGAAAWERGKGKSPCAGFLDRFDKDGDGRVSADEYPGRPARFEALDANDDGFVDESEQPREKQRARRGNPMQRFDTDGDGRLSVSEFPGPDAAFERADQNADGYVDESEMPRRGRPGGDPMARLDDDGDGRISAEEFPGPEDHFARFDQDGDGFLSEDELPPPPPRRGCGGKRPTR